MANAAISVSSVSKSFKLPHEKHSSLKSAFINILKTKRTYENQQVLKNISFEIKEGEFFGIVGRNGSGKSTLLKLLAGVYSPDEGSIQINGKLTPFIELGVGFNPELTGRENVFLNGALLGFSRREMEGLYDEIVSFAELEKFMDQKLKNYSSGMQVRLAFSIAIRARSEILLLDEVLAVGDAIFQKKCYDYFKQLKKQKNTVVFVSHDMSALQEYCDKGILINDGNLVYEGKIDKVLNRYIDIITTDEKEQSKKLNEPADKVHIGSGEITVEKIKIASPKGEEKVVFEDKDDTIVLTVSYKINEDIDEPIYGFTVFDRAGQRIFVTNNMWAQQKVPTAKKGSVVKAVWEVPNIFNSGTYTITPAAAGRGGSITYDQVDDMISFKIRKRAISNAYTNPVHTLKLSEER